MLQLNVDCLILIFNKLQDRNSLHSCLLVNREWCHLVVPILWRKFSWREINKSISNIILSFLPSSSKQLLSDNNIKLPQKNLLKSPLFNYISFCEFPSSNVIKAIIKMIFNDYGNDKINILEQEIYKLFISQCENVKKSSWLTSQLLSLLPGASTCFSQLHSLSIDLIYIDPSVLYEMAHICKDLNELEIFYCHEDFPGLVSLIDAQRNLSKIKIYHRNRSNYYRRGYYDERESNTINNIDLSLGTITSSFPPSLVNLTQLSIYYSGNINEIKEFQQYLAISKFPNLQSLSFNGPSSCFKEIAILIGKTRGNILRVHISGYYEIKVPTNTGMVIESIANNCPKFNFLHIYLRPIDFIYVKLLLLNCGQLKVVTFNDLTNETNILSNMGDELLDNLAKYSSESLNYVTISGNWEYSVDGFERFFESCRERPLQLFYVFNSKRITESHKSVVRKYINEGLIKNSNLCIEK